MHPEKPEKAPEWFVALMRGLSMDYRDFGERTASGWSKKIDHWWKALKVFRQELISGVFAQARVHSPKWAPTVGEIYSIALEEYTKEQKRRIADQTAAKVKAQSWAIEQREGKGREKNRFDTLAEKWENESREKGIIPEQVTPVDLQRRRMAEFWDTWRDSGDGRD